MTGVFQKLFYVVYPVSRSIPVLHALGMTLAGPFRDVRISVSCKRAHAHRSNRIWVYIQPVPGMYAYLFKYVEKLGTRTHVIIVFLMQPVRFGHRHPKDF